VLGRFEERDVTCGFCGGTDGWHWATCSWMRFPTLGMGTVPLATAPDLPFDDELLDCAAEGIASLDHARGQAT
jgi:hypothetical protein